MFVNRHLVMSLPDQKIYLSFGNLNLPVSPMDTKDEPQSPKRENSASEKEVDDFLDDDFGVGYM
jgi:hypothetical protein